MKSHILILSTLTALLCINCNKEEDLLQTVCDEVVTLNSEKYKNKTTDFFTLIEVNVEGDCMNIKYSSSGCSGESWVMELIDAEVIKETNPAQRDLRLILKNEEACQAVFTKDISFDLAPLKTGDSEILLNLEGEQYSYKY